jgi:CheY-like chemotaxis protein
MRKIILLAEDNPDDVLIFQIAFRRAVLPYDIYVVRDGEQVVEYLMGRSNYADRQRFPLPDILVLDLKMPVKSGLEVLEWLRGHGEFSGLRVVVLSSSDDNRDVRKVEELGVRTYFVKTPRLQNIVDHLRAT